MPILTYRAIIQKDGDSYRGSVPALIGCNTDGETIEEVRHNLREAISAWIATTQEIGWEIPLDESMETIESVEVAAIA